LSTGDLRLRAAAAALLDDEGLDDECEDAPPTVSVVPRLEDNIRTILTLMTSELPVLRRIRCKKSSKAYYGFGDASGLGFGAPIQIGDDIWF
jgi:hypothetical protein